MAVGFARRRGLRARSRDLHIVAQLRKPYVPFDEIINAKTFTRFMVSSFSLHGFFIFLAYFGMFQNSPNSLSEERS